MDVFSREKRSSVMSAIRSRRNRSTEEAFATLLKKFQITGWRRHYGLPGKPDFAFPKARIAIFIDGCFWHQCSKCYDGHVPKQNKAYWEPKLARNQQRDRKNNALLRARNWHVFRIRECSITKQRGAVLSALTKIARACENNSDHAARSHRKVSNRAA